MCNGLISTTVGLLVTKMGLSSRMVIGVVANGVARAVANGSRQLGLGLGSDRHEWCCRGRRGWFVMIGFEFGFGSLQMLLPDRGKWFCWTVANGCRRRFGSFRRW